MRTKILLTLTALLLTASGVLCQVGIREKDPDAYKFIGTWAYEANGELFSITFWIKDAPIGSKEDGSTRTTELLMGTWKVKNSQGEGEYNQYLAVIGATIKNPNMVEGRISNQDYGKDYAFTLEFTGSNEAIWNIVREIKMGNPKAGAILIAPPTECVMKKVE